MTIKSACGILVALLGLQSGAAFAGLTATATITETPAGSDYNYAITLQNTGTTTVGTFWYAWIPGANYLTTPPLSVTSPSGWSEQVTHDFAGDGYGVEWTANSSASYITAGSSLPFSFESADTPTSVMGLSAIYPTTPTGTSFVYSQGAFSDSGYQFVVAAVPEPSPLILVAGAFATALGVCHMRRRRRPLAA